MYDISYDIAALVIVIVLYLIHTFFYTNEGNNRIFRFFVGAIFLNCILDIVASVIMSDGFDASDSLMIIVHTLYNIATVLIQYLVYRAVISSIGFNNRIVLLINKIILYVGLILIVVNYFTGIQFTFIDGEFIKTYLYYWLYASMFWYLMNLLISICVMRKVLNTTRFYVVLAGIFMIPLPSILQVVFPMIRLIPLGSACIAFLLIFTLSTPDYEQLQNVKLELEKARADEIASKEMAEKKSAEKSHFLDNMSHELRTPLNAVSGFNRMIQNSKVSEATEQNAHNIQEAAENLLKLVVDILDYSQIESFSMEIKPEEYETIRIYLFNQKTDENTIDLSIPCRLYGDISRIRQVLDNILSYGKNNIPGGRIGFSLKKKDTNENGVNLVFEYKYLGYHMSQDEIDILMLDTIAEEMPPFAIAHKILGSMESELSVYTEGMDTVISFELQQQIVDLKEIESIEEAIARSKRLQMAQILVDKFKAPTATILAVDDVKINLMILGSVLEAYGVKYIQALSGKEAIDIMGKTDVDLVFMDIMMPEMDGVETLYSIRSNANIISHEAPIVALTANVTDGARETYLSEGFDGYLSKPIDVAALDMLLRHFLVDKITADWDEVMGIDSKGKVL